MSKNIENVFGVYYNKAQRLADEVSLGTVYLEVRGQGGIGQGLEMTYTVGLDGRYGEKVEASNFTDAWREACRRRGWEVEHSERKLLGKPE